jgi:hypothetical protein
MPPGRNWRFSTSSWAYGRNDDRGDDVRVVHLEAAVLHRAGGVRNGRVVCRKAVLDNDMGLR